jgi:hypothetical protein
MQLKASVSERLFPDNSYVFTVDRRTLFDKRDTDSNVAWQIADGGEDRRSLARSEFQMNRLRFVGNCGDFVPSAEGFLKRWEEIVPSNIICIDVAAFYAFRDPLQNDVTRASELRHEIIHRQKRVFLGSILSRPDSELHYCVHTSYQQNKDRLLLKRPNMSYCMMYDGSSFLALET